MAAKKLRRAKLSQELCERLSRYQITTCQDFLCLSLLELMKVTGQSYRNVQKLLRQVSLACAPKMQTAYEMKVRRSVNPSSAFLSTTLHSLDKVLHGGVPCGSLTEITSPPGCGKTQFCIMMSVLATLPVSMGGLDGAVVYIDTESAFSAERLVEIAGNRFPTYFDSDEKLFCMTRSVHLYRELTCDSVLKRIKSLEEEIISKKVKLIIIDSVASVVRKEFDTKLQGNLAERSNFLARGASLLKYLAEEFSIPANGAVFAERGYRSVAPALFRLLPTWLQLQQSDSTATACPELRREGDSFLQAVLLECTLLHSEGIKASTSAEFEVNKLSF
uniref:DNA repair protein RAD51 homolog 2 n=1 Tax=Anas platyrhynchos platyrhynchos TaxID=8840 RepID=A0A493SXL2_ANAPP